MLKFWQRRKASPRLTPLSTSLIARLIIMKPDIETPSDQADGPGVDQPQRHAGARRDPHHPQLAVPADVHPDL